MRRCSALSSTRMRSRSLASRLESGSSSSRIDGSTTSERASATRCCWPPESWPGWRCSSPARPTAASTRATLSRDLAAGRPWRSGARRPRSRTPSCAATRRSSGTPCPCGAAPAGPRPAARRAAGRRRGSCRWSGVRKPASVRSIVVLPQPEGPRKVMNSFSAMSRSTPFNAWKLPKACQMPDLDERHGQLRSVSSHRRRRRHRRRPGPTAS